MSYLAVLFTICNRDGVEGRHWKHQVTLRKNLIAARINEGY
jgi:hypothetical protein